MGREKQGEWSWGAAEDWKEAGISLKQIANEPDCDLLIGKLIKHIIVTSGVSFYHCWHIIISNSEHKNPH